MIGKVFDRIEAIKPVATKTESLLIDGIKTIDKNELVYLSITELSAMFNIAEATILRFCRKLGYKGFQDFKLSLSQDLGNEKFVDGEKNCPKRIADDMADAIFETCKQIDYDECLKIAAKIVSARKICMYGAGNSGIAPHATKNRLIKAGINIDTSEDNHLQTIIVSSLRESDLLILISVSGSTKDIIKLAEIAKNNGTPIVVITNYDKSPIVKFADYRLFTCRKEAAYEGGSLSTVVAQTYIIDVLCTAVFETIGSEAAIRSMNASSAVSDKSL